MIDFAQGVGLLAGTSLIAVLAVREWRWPRRLGTGGRWTVCVLFLVVMLTAALQILRLVFPAT
jgi:hypothetical protein